MFASDPGHSCASACLKGGLGYWSRGSGLDMLAAVDECSDRIGGGKGKGRRSAEQKGSGRERRGGRGSGSRSGSVQAGRAKIAVDDRMHMCSALSS